MDNLTFEQRKKCMKNIKRSDTKIELMFRRTLYNAGIRGYRIKNKLKEHPDIYIPKINTAIYIDGCFWHKCPKCYKEPKSNQDYWIDKINTNVERDKKQTKSLTEKGINVVRFWEHDIKKDCCKAVGKIIAQYE